MLMKESAYLRREKKRLKGPNFAELFMSRICGAESLEVIREGIEHKSASEKGLLSKTQPLISKDDERGEVGRN